MGSIRSRPCRHLRRRRVSFQHERIIINVRSERNKRYQYNIRYSVININNVFGSDERTYRAQRTHTRRMNRPKRIYKAKKAHFDT